MARKPLLSSSKNQTLSPKMTFQLAKRLELKHLIVQPSDLRFNPPESYFYIQDGFIVSCGAFYVLCYFFYMTRTVKDKTCAGPVEYLGATMAYEIFYAHKTTSTTTELGCFFMWFLFDLTFVSVAVFHAYPTHQRRAVIVRLFIVFCASTTVFNWLCRRYPDDREQITAFWTGVALQLPISMGSLWLLIQNRHTKGHSLEIWITRFMGCVTAYGLFFWRYWNIPENWHYVGSPWSVGLIGITLLVEAVYPFAYVWVWSQEREVTKGQKVK